MIKKTESSIENKMMEERGWWDLLTILERKEIRIEVTGRAINPKEFEIGEGKEDEMYERRKGLRKESKNFKSDFRYDGKISSMIKKWHTCCWVGFAEKLQREDILVSATGSGRQDISISITWGFKHIGKELSQQEAIIFHFSETSIGCPPHLCPATPILHGCSPIPLLWSH